MSGSKGYCFSRLERQMVNALRQHLDNHGRTVNVPEAGRIIWGWFADLCRTRTYGFSGPNPIAYSEIEAYARLYRWPLEKRHIDLILAMDRSYLQSAQTGMTKPTTPSTDLSPAIFDAVF